MGNLLHDILEFITSMGYWGILIGLMLEVIPSEIVLAYAGYLVFKGEINAVEAVIFGTIGCLIQQIFLYWIGRYGGRPFVDKYGKYIHLKSKHIDVTERWFQKYGAVVVFTARFVPVLRQAISIPAGIAKMSMTRFLIYTGIATVPWAILFVWLGKGLGENWDSIEEEAGPLMHYIMYGAIAVTILYILYKLVTRKNTAKAAGAAAASGYVGEKHVDRLLEDLGDEYRVLNGRVVEGRTGSQAVDHLIVGPNGLFHIETKNWGGPVRFTGKEVERGSEGHREDPTALLYRHEFLLKELLRAGKHQADVTGILCFSNPECTVTGDIPAFHAVKLDGLIPFITKHKPKHPLAEKEVRAIAKLLEENSSAGR